MPSGNPCTRILPRYQNHFDCAGQKKRSSGNENENENENEFLIYRSCAMRFAALFARKFPREISHYVSGFQFADKSFHRCALCFLFDLFILF